MKRWILALLLLVVVGMGTSCVKAPPNLTPQANTAFYATQVIKQLDHVRDFAADAHKTQPPILSKAGLLAVVKWHEALVTTIHASPNGWKATALAGLDQLQSVLSADDYAKASPYIAGAKTTILSL